MEAEALVSSRFSVYMFHSGGTGGGSDNVDIETHSDSPVGQVLWWELADGLYS